MKTLREKIVYALPVFIQKLIFPSWIEVREFIKSITKEIPDKSAVLDAGAGQCKYKDFFKSCKYIAIDSAVGDTAWDYSRINVAGDLASLPFKNNSFDIVISTQVLEHLKEPGTFIAEAYRVLRHGGALYISAPQGWGVHQAPNDFFRFTSYGLKHLFEKAGFKIDYITPSCGYFGYLANRISMLPKYMFWYIKNPLIRFICLPFELFSYFIFSLIFPVILNLIDFLDKQREYTLNYFVKGIKKPFP